MPNEQEYTISELASLAGVTPRTIRYYISIGLLPSPGQVGPKTAYGDGYLQRLHLIRQLQRDHLPLGEIGARLDGLDDEAVERALDEYQPADASGSALEYIRRLQEGGEPPGQPNRSLREAPDTGAPMPQMAPTGPPPDPKVTQRSQWDRVELSHNVELHIRRPLSRPDNKRVERLIRIGREMLEEDQS
ncbi:MAG: MerR family transcriptional regulator [Chloroflexota bacterium]